jgi:peptidoglycan/xylan/chitin deacetylase (PgdA/CDA1 family)
VPKVTLTFDNGPEPKITHQVLDTLAHYNLQVTFFVIGQKLVNPGAWEAAARAAQLGHWIGNHTYTHRIPLGNTKEPTTAADEIGRTQELIGRLAHPDKLFRPFGGGGVIGKHLLSRSCYKFLRAGGYTCVLWNSVPRDWENKEIIRLFLRLGFTAFGGPAAHIAMMHDEVVVRRRWIDEQHFLDLVGATNLIPGPNSTEMAIHIGYDRAGWRGLVAAGVCFILPAALIVGILAWAVAVNGGVSSSLSSRSRTQIPSSSTPPLHPSHRLLSLNSRIENGTINYRYQGRCTLLAQRSLHYVIDDCTPSGTPNRNILSQP